MQNSTPPVDFSPTTSDNQKKTIRELQKYLRTLSYIMNIPRIIPDGIYDSSTANAVRAYQNAKGLAPTGKTDRTTWDSIYADYLAVSALAAPPNTIAPFPNGIPGFTYKAGSENNNVYIIQVILEAISLAYDGFETIDINGLFDTKTENAVREFQRINGLDITGEVDKLTWNRLAASYQKYAFSEG